MQLTCGVKVEVLEKVLASMASSIAAAGIQANVITSGHGDWRYMDVVPVQAGKLEALQYVQGRRTIQGWPSFDCHRVGHWHDGFFRHLVPPIQTGPFRYDWRRQG